MNELQVGVVGCGGIGGVHLRAWAQVEDARVTAACDADPERAAAGARVPGCPLGVRAGGRAYQDYRAMLDAEELDAVDVCTPPHLHAEVAIAALERGLPTLCEKPLARTPDEARAILRAADRSGALLMTAFCHRFHPPVELVRGLIQEGRLGRVLMFRNRFGTRFTGVENRWFSQPEIAGGGALMDTSIHSVDLFRHLVGEVASAAAAVHAFHPELQQRPRMEDCAAMLLKSVDGAVGVIEASWMTPWSANVVEVYGELGAAVIDYDTGETRWRLQGETGWTRAETSGDRFAAEVRHFAAAVRGEEELRVTGLDGLRAVEVLYEAYGHPVGR